MKLKTKLVSISAVAMMLVLSTAYAWDGAVQGIIQTIDVVGGVSGPNNQDVRVYLVGGVAICTGGGLGAWGYINTVDPNVTGQVVRAEHGQSRN